RHPYTWGLLSSMPDVNTVDEELYTIPGTPPNLLRQVPGDAFAPRNHYAMKIDYIEEPPMFNVGGKHRVSTWLAHEKAPKVSMPASLKQRIENMKKEAE
ncbi:MAG: ABC transporter ATP-binding protein, partial [Erysipelotrichaceae bacterium]|nr:ABC transporter ATP-binding protein [Erysipelotrichaceae bacterium]